MILTELRSQSRRLTHTNETNYPDDVLDLDIQQANGEVQMMKIEAEGYKTDGDFKVIDFETTTGLSAQELGYNGEYPFSSDALRLEEVHLDYGNGHVKAETVNKCEIGSEMFEDLGGYSEAKPKVFIFRDSFFTRPLLTGAMVPDGIKLIITPRQKTIVETVSDVDTETLTPNFEANFHQLIPLKVAQDYYLINPDKYNPRIDRKVQELESQFISYYQDRVPVVNEFKAVRERY